MPSGWPKLYISRMHSKLNLHLDGFPGTDATEGQPLRPSSLNGFDLSFLGLLCKDDVGQCAVYQHNVTVAIKSHYMQPNGC